MTLLHLILLTTAFRLCLAWAIGLGVDESYMVAAGRTLSLGYFDHPPAAWWLSWGSTHLFASEAPVVARLPFILLFALTTWMMAQIGTILGGPRAGFWAAAALNLSPVFGVTGGGWVLPDGPLDCALTGAALCLLRALPAEGKTAWKYWCGAGICSGLALFSKYSAALTIAGAFAFLLFHREHRLWLRRPEPYVAGALALLVFSPVILWNATHDWASFAFQGARATGPRFRPLAPFETLAGEALFVLPWIWLPLMILGWNAFRGDWRARLLACLAAPPVLVFALIAAWSSQRVLYHWAAPGYLMLFPLLGCFLARHQEHPALRRAVLATAGLTVAAAAVVSAHVRLDLLGPLMPARDPTAEGLVWTSLRDDLTARGLLPPGTIVGVPNWRDAGKIAHALGPEVTVLCLNPDSRQFGLSSPAGPWAGTDLLVLSTDRPERALPALNRYFDVVDALPPSAVTLRGRSVKTIAVARGKGLKPPAAW